MENLKATTKEQSKESNTKTYGTWQPDFPGFYDTLYAYNYDDIEYSLFDNPDSVPEEYLSWFTDNIYDYVNNKEYEKDVCKLFVEEWTKSAKEQLPIIESVEFEEQVSPREYNFTTDSINIQIKIDLDKLIKLFRESSKAAQYLKDTYTSCDGFWSHYDNDLEAWLKDIEEDTNHKIGAMLDCLVDIDDMGICSDVTESIYQPDYIDFDKMIADFNREFSLSIKELSDLQK